MFADRLIASREKMIEAAQAATDEALLRSGGDVGFAATVPVRGHHIFEPSSQRRNRGNGKGGGIAAAGLIPEQLGVDARTLREEYIYQVALLDEDAENEVEQSC